MDGQFLQRHPTIHVLTDQTRRSDDASHNVGMVWCGVACGSCFPCWVRIVIAPLHWLVLWSGSGKVFP